MPALFCRIDRVDVAPLPLSPRPRASRRKLAVCAGCSRARDSRDAEAAAQALLVEVPENRDVLYMLAVSQRYLGSASPRRSRRSSASRSCIRDYPRLYQERGHCYVAQRAADPAIAAFERAVTLNPALPRELGDAAGAVRDERPHTTRRRRQRPTSRRLAGLPRRDRDRDQHVRGRRDRRRRAAGARAISSTTAITSRPCDFSPASALKLDVLDDAELLLESVLSIAPEYHAARYDYAHGTAAAPQACAGARADRACCCRSSPRTAPIALTQRDRLRPASATASSALPLYRRAAARRLPQIPELHLSIGARAEDAWADSRRRSTRIAAAAAAGRATAMPTGVSRTSRLTVSPTRSSAACERRGRAAHEPRGPLSSVLCARQGARGPRRVRANRSPTTSAAMRSRRRECRYRPGSHRAQYAAAEGSVHAGVLRRARGLRAPRARRRSSSSGCRGPARRSSSRSSRRIARSRAHGAGRHPAAGAGAAGARERRGAEPRYPGGARRAAAPRTSTGSARSTWPTPRSIAPASRASSTRCRTTSGTSASSISSCRTRRIIDARREPMACCFSNFKQLFASGQQFTYSLEDIAPLLSLLRGAHGATGSRCCRRGGSCGCSTRNWSRILSSTYGAYWNSAGSVSSAACVEFHKTRSARCTRASSEQVRQPIYREGLDQWRHFEPWLGALKTALGDLAPRSA